MFAKSPSPSSPPSARSVARASQPVPRPLPTPSRWQVTCAAPSGATGSTARASFATLVGCSASSRFQVPSQAMMIRFMGALRIAPDARAAPAGAIVNRVSREIRAGRRRRGRAL